MSYLLKYWPNLIACILYSFVKSKRYLKVWLQYLKSQTWTLFIVVMRFGQWRWSFCHWGVSVNVRTNHVTLLPLGADFRNFSGGGQICNSCLPSRRQSNFGWGIRRTLNPLQVTMQMYMFKTASDFSHT